MIRLLALLLLVPGYLFADTVSIRAGYKSEYTRFVLSTPSDVEWMVEEDLGFATIVFEDDISLEGSDDIFDRIPGERIRAVTQIDDRSIRVDLRCDCEVRSFQWRPSKFVVDFIGNDEIFDRPRFREKPEEVEEDTVIPRLDQKPRTDVPDLLASSLRQKELRELEQALSQSIGIAATQGFLKPKEGSAITPNEKEVFAEVIPQGDIGLRSKTAFSQEEPDKTSGYIQSDTCPNERDFEFLYEKDEDFVTRVSALRREHSLAHDLDKDQIQKKHAELLLRHGFGLEAKAKIEELSAEQQGLIAKIAVLIDRDFPSRELAILSRCEGTSQLLGVLASNSRISLTAEDAKSIARAYVKLAPALRARFRGKLTRILLDDEHRETARIVFETPHSYSDLRDTDLSSVQADLDEGAGVQDVAVPERVDAQDLSHDPGLVAEIIEASLSEGFAPDDRVLSLAEVMAYEFRSEEISKKLQELLIDNEIAFGDLELARSKLEAADLPSEIHRRLRNRWMREVAERGGANTFLAAAFGRQPFDFPKDIRTLFSERLLTVGFNDVANTWSPNFVPDEKAVDLMKETKPKAENPATQRITEMENPIASGRALLDEVTMLRDSIEKIVSNKQ